IELALEKAQKAKLIDYTTGARNFAITGEVTADQKKALEYMKGFIEKNGTGVREVLNRVVFSTLDMIVVYPVEDENKYSDHAGNVLPDAFLVKRGTTAQELANKVHTDLGKQMLYAVNAKTKMRIPKEHV